MKKLYKALLFTALVAALALSVALIGGCKEDTEPTGPVSSLRGTFTYNATLGGTSEQRLALTTDPAALTDGSFSLYCGQGAPFTNALGINFAYQINQNLVLARDFTYVYTYSIVIKNPAAWGGTYGKTETTVSGTFEFTAGGDKDEYDVRLSAPTGGTQEFFGIIAGDPNNAYNGWSPSTEPTYAQNFDYADCFDGYDYTFIGNVKAESGEFTGERTLTVDKEDNSVSDDMFYAGLFDFLALYGKY